MPRSMTTTVLVIGLGAVLVMAMRAPARAETAREILDRAKALDDTTRKWTDRTETMELNIHAKGGGKRQRTLTVYDKRFSGDDDKTVSFFLSPPEVKGTAFLQWSHKDRDDDQWLYLPEVKRSRRITSRARDQSFMGTDFSYRDLEILGEIQDWTEADAPSTLTGVEEVDGHACHVIELHPRQEGMRYGKIVVWLDKELLVFRKMDFYDTGSTLEKTLSQTDIRDIGPIPTAHHLEMRNTKKGSRTEVVLSNIAYDTNLADSLFTERQLQRGAP